MIAAGRLVIPYKPGDIYRLWPLYDLHFGSHGCAESRAREYIGKAVADKHGLWIVGGDCIDAIGYRDKRFNPMTMPDWLKVADLGRLTDVLFSAVEDMLRPGIGRGFAALWGNHEDVRLRDTQDWERWVQFCDTLRVPNLEICGLRDLVFRERSGVEHSFRIAMHHGAGFAATRGGKINRLAKTIDDFPGADLVLIGHLHDQISTSKTGIDADAACEKITDVTRMGVMCGTWLRTYTQGPPGYGEVRGYSPTPIGNPVIEIDPMSRDMSVRWIR